MITLTLILIAVLAIGFLMVFLVGLVSVSPILGALLLLPVVDILVIKWLICGRKKKEEDDDEDDDYIEVESKKRRRR